MKDLTMVQVNYWKEIRKEINKTFEPLHSSTSLTNDSIKFSGLIDFLKNLRRNQQITILYVALINSYDHVKQSLQTNLLSSKKLFVGDYVYRKPPYFVNEMKNLLNTFTNVILKLEVINEKPEWKD